MNRKIIRALSSAALFLLVFGCFFAVSCSSGDKEIIDYADNFYDIYTKQIDANNAFLSEYNNADLDTDYGISMLQKNLPKHINTFNEFLNSYQNTLPKSAPSELIDAVTYARDGTSKYIAGITTINIGLTNRSNTQIFSGVDMINEGIDTLKLAGTGYDSFADSFNSRSQGGYGIGLGILIGTGVLWGLGFLVVNPLTKYLSKRKFALQPVGSNLPQSEQDISELVISTYNRTYMIVNIIVLSIAGFLMGILIGWFFIGIAWKARMWPGLIAFIGFSVLGSFLYGL